MTNDEAPGALISADKLAQVLPLSREQIWRHVRDNTLPHYRIGRRVFFDFAEVKAALKVPAGQAAGNGAGEE